MLNVKSDNSDDRSDSRTASQQPQLATRFRRKPKRRVSRDADFVEPLLKTFPSIIERRLHLAAFELVIAAGVIFLGFHFLHIRNFPELDFASSLGLLALVAVSGIALIVFVGFILLGPANVWLIFMETEAGKRIIADLHDDSQKAARENVKEVSFEDNHQNQTRPDSESNKFLKLPALFVIPISMTTLFSIIVFFAVVWTNYLTTGVGTALTLLSLFAIFPIGWLTHRHLLLKHNFPKFEWNEMRWS